jgi:hypothetical protein
MIINGDNGSMDQSLVLGSAPLNPNVTVRSGRLNHDFASPDPLKHQVSSSPIIPPPPSLPPPPPPQTPPLLHHALPPHQSSSNYRVLPITNNNTPASRPQLKQVKSTNSSGGGSREISITHETVSTPSTDLKNQPVTATFTNSNPRLHQNENDRFFDSTTLYKKELKQKQRDLIFSSSSVSSLGYGQNTTSVNSTPTCSSSHKNKSYNSSTGHNSNFNNTVQSNHQQLSNNSSNNISLMMAGSASGLNQSGSFLSTNSSFYSSPTGPAALHNNTSASLHSHGSSASNLLASKSKCCL